MRTLGTKPHPRLCRAGTIACGGGGGQQPHSTGHAANAFSFDHHHAGLSPRARPSRCRCRGHRDAHGYAQRHRRGSSAEGEARTRGKADVPQQRRSAQVARPLALKRPCPHGRPRVPVQQRHSQIARNHHRRTDRAIALHGRRAYEPRAHPRRRERSVRPGNP